MAGFTPDPGTVQTGGDLPTLTSRLNALGKYLGVTIFGISGARTPAHSVAVGGSADDPHVQHKAEDIGVGSQLRSSASGISETVLNKFGLTRPFAGAAEVNHIQLLPGAVTPRATQASLGGIPSYVPRAYRGWVRSASQGTGIPEPIVAAQINEESGFDPTVTSSAGAEGIAQFLPSTFKSYSKGSPFNVQDSLVAYTGYMSALLIGQNGNIRNALAAYNAGPGNLAAGYGYADTILAAAGAPRTASAGSAPSFGGTRPGGKPTDSGAGVDKIFSDYETEVNLPRTAPASTFSTPGSKLSAPFAWWWQSFSGAYAQQAGDK